MGQFGWPPGVGAAGQGEGRLLTVRSETPGEHDEVHVNLEDRRGGLHADLRIGANVAGAKALQANLGISSPGVKLHGSGFIVTPEEATQLGLGREPGLEQRIRQYRNGRDLTATPRGSLVIDLFGLSAEEVRTRYPATYQWVHDRVKPERDAKGQSKDGAAYAKLWWLFGKPRQEMRKQLAGLPRYIATVETTKHRTFQFLDASVLPDNMLIAIALNDVLALGILSSVLHVDWSLATGGTLEDRPRYNKTRCFETFPFPSDDTGFNDSSSLAAVIRDRAEAIDLHRKRVLTCAEGQKAGLTLTGLYNVLEALRAGRTLSAKEKLLHDNGLVGVLRSLHDELDAAVLQAYGWSDLGTVPWSDENARQAWTEALLERLVALNARRAAEEARGQIRWLRPEFQDPARRVAVLGAAADSSVQTGVQDGLAVTPDDDDGHTEPDSPVAPATTTVTTRRPWPSELPEQMRATAEVLAASPLALSTDALAEHFKGQGPWKKRLPQILETLEAVGRAIKVPGEGVAHWTRA